MERRVIARHRYFLQRPHGKRPYILVPFTNIKKASMATIPPVLLNNSLTTPHRREVIERRQPRDTPTRPRRPSPRPRRHHQRPRHVLQRSRQAILHHPRRHHRRTRSPHRRSRWAKHRSLLPPQLPRPSPPGLPAGNRLPEQFTGTPCVPRALLEVAGRGALRGGRRAPRGEGQRGGVRGGRGGREAPEGGVGAAAEVEGLGVMHGDHAGCWVLEEVQRFGG
mmetsp:Transcript_15039/g.40406  ORF Transcript_15039/g.40406 Transcript_15039/m.40406 type:complete len:222 (+) Transcript_15039:212-877(+)